MAKVIVEPEATQSRLNWAKGGLVILALLILVNLVFLDYWLFFKDKGKIEPEKSIEPKPADQLAPEISPSAAKVGQLSRTLGQEDGCPQACLEAIAEVNQCQTCVSGEAAKEIYIPLGRGSTSSRDYEEIVGAEAVIDLDRYPEIETIYFEANMEIPAGGGRIYAKLYNVTDKHDAWNSEVYLDGSGPYRAEAKDVVLASGRKLYRVKMKSTLGTEGVLDLGRIKILLK